MMPWKLLDSAQVPEGGEALHLYQRGGEFSIRVGSRELMNSRVHGSEGALAELACVRIAHRPSPRVLIGGLGMGYTTAAALHRLGAHGQVVVAELVPAVVAWNRGLLQDLAGRPLHDARVTVRETDVVRILQAEQRAYDAILLDVDNGPAGLTRKGNDWLYTRAGLDTSYAALRAGGVLSAWSASPDRTFAKCLCRAGFKVTEVCAWARGARGGGRHIVWLALRMS
jgi:spermidine synthase